MSSESVKVVVRCRPMNEKERRNKFDNVVSVNVKLGQITVRNPKEASASSPAKVLTFDSVYDWDSKQIDLYDKTFRPLVDSVLLGFNGTIFAYGQTGTGKTYTMEGVRNDQERRGVIPNAFEHIFTHISQSQNQQYLVRASFLEIYQDEIKDLLSKDQSHSLELRERPDTGVYVKGLSSFVTKSVQEIGHVMKVGNQNRSVGATNMNEHSSRSHTIFVITVECSELGVDGENHIRVGKLNLVDLAGSERQLNTGAEGQRLKESTKINQSLFALGNVMSALVDGRSSHIPYQDSKLTRLLQDSLGGNAWTIMVANIGPASNNIDETLTTLYYSNRAKNIKNKPCINDDPKDTLLREFQEEIARLKAQLQKRLGEKRGSRGRRAGEGSNGDDLKGETEDDNEDGDDGGDYWWEQQVKLERERNVIMEDHSLVAEEKVWLLKKKEKKMGDLRREREAGEMLAAKVKEMESKLLVGGKNIIDNTKEQQRMLQQRRHEIDEKCLQKNREREMQQQVEYRDEETLELKDIYTALQKDVNIKTKKLKKLFAMLQEIKAEILNIKVVHNHERQELEYNQNDLTKDLKLKRLIIENFIPPVEKSKIDNRIYFDEEDELWKLKPITRIQMPLSAVGYRNPSIRNRDEYIKTLELDFPTRKTFDYQAPVVAPALLEVLRNAVKIDEVMVIDASDCERPASAIPSLKKPNSSRPQTGRKSSSPCSTETPLYPKCRGLVPM
ncbi:kinesin-like protein KIF3B isoform X2 [Paralichthys olivaceus]|uniref:kinesin-like protein KIF3B isoform X2 n=1 Tax=Paralichthys olivaceus TaxID=8255 RepID=UPI0037533BFB